MLTEAQIAERKSGIGSSEIASVCGLSSWSSPIDVWLNKTGQAQPARDGDGLQLEIGHALEPLIADRYSRTMGVVLVNPQQVFRSALRDWQLATPDRLRNIDDQPVECKVAYSSDGWGDDGTDQVPQEYLCQVQWQMDVLNAQFCHLAAIVGRSFRIFVIRKDDDLCGALRDAAERFWKDHVLTGIQPAVTGHERDKMYLQQRFEKYEARMLKAEPTHEDVAAAYADAKARYEAAEEAVELYGNQLRELIGEAEGLQGAGWRCTWKAPKPSNVVDWQSIAAEVGAPDALIAKHTRPKQNSRRFLFTQKG
jgi:putative phage-type endonuclease